MLTLLIATAAAAQPASETSPAAARAVVERYYAALEGGRYRTAYLFWSDSGQASGKTLPAFAAGFARTRRTHVAAGAPTDGEGAAGSVFVTVPVRIDAVLKNGTRQRFAGTYVLRRVNGIAGATQEQLRWHIASAKLRMVR